MIYNIYVSKNENNPSEYDRLVKDWRKVWEEWNEVMARITLTSTPPDEDLESAKRLGEQVDAAWERLKEFQAILINRQR